jgi:hypothetical protein
MIDLLWVVLYGALVLVGGHAHGDDCGTAEPSLYGGWMSRWRDSNEETKLFGDSVSYVGQLQIIMRTGTDAIALSWWR